MILLGNGSNKEVSHLVTFSKRTEFSKKDEDSTPKAGETSRDFEFQKDSKTMFKYK